MRDKGVSVIVSQNFYRYMERLRIEHKLKTKKSIRSHRELTEMMVKNPRKFVNKNWVKRKGNGGII